VGVALAGVAAGVAIFALALGLAGSGKVEVRLGDDEFVLGRADRLAGQVEQDGPLLFQDLLGRPRDIYVQHLGDRRWVAFEAHAPRSPRRCQLRWDGGKHQFRDPCDGAVYPADGAGLTRYPVRIDEDSRLVVNLRQAQTP
jgi:hypothetical protein